MMIMVVFKLKEERNNVLTERESVLCFLKINLEWGLVDMCRLIFQNALVFCRSIYTCLS